MKQETFLKQLAVPDSAIIQQKVTTQGGTIVLSNPPDPSSPFKPHMKTTTSIDELRSWVQGLPAPANLKATAADAPAVVEQYKQLGAPQVDQLLTDAQNYVTGAGDLTSEQKVLIENVHGPFSVPVYAVANVTICGNSPLVIAGPGPVILSFNNVDLFTGGQIIVKTNAKIDIQQLTKHDAPCN